MTKLCDIAFEEAITTMTLLQPYLAHSLIGWNPRKPAWCQHPKFYLTMFVAEDSRSGSRNVEIRVLVPIYSIIPKTPAPNSGPQLTRNLRK